ncbi:AAA family ATPase [Leucobacter chromiireducens]|uniref:AAA+ ATPase domain-containing protein n=1 Tax=Leucobacter chromiireducens subsp. solipictus TaxID=398235 RepID=A0ABS1SF26_9MICO|nr:AAA family ATPase [Leucobacter chromiireducens]MBL3679151.1 hypothetical protein [Leucobacter chromiireducens subsp. solipictus]
MLHIQVTPDALLAELRSVADELRQTRRALRADWAAAGRAPAELERLLTATAPPAHELDDCAAPIRLGVTSVRELRARLATLSADPTLAEGALDRALTERARTLRAAIVAHRADVRAEDARDAAAELVAHAAAARRTLTPAEQRAVRAAARDEKPGSAGRRLPAGVPDALAALRVRQAQRELRAGLLLSAQMRDVIRAALPALRSGAPLLIIGETGGAKTALAEALARRTGKAPEFVSGYGDISTAQLIGSHELRNDRGVTVTDFEPGPLLRAMREGRPLILDEVNAMPAEFLKRLNRILQLRPGAEFAVQEQAGERVRIAPGFTILATANEHAPHRYRGIEPLSAELVNRFGAHTFRVRYPDAALGYTEFPRENALLAMAAVATDLGELPPGMTPAHIELAARAAFVSQQVFSGNSGEGFERFVATEQQADRAPGLEETVIAPRTLVAILERVALEGTADALHAALSRFADGVMHPEDRRTLTLILEGQGVRWT